MMVKILLLSLLLIPVQAQAQGRIIALDVKEGQSILIKHKDKGLLIDTGHAGQSISVLNKLRKYGIEKVEIIILTHLHPDHVGGYFRLTEAFPSAKIYSNCHPLPINIQPDTLRWLYESLQTNPEHHCLKAGDVLSFYDAELTTLWPHVFVNNNLNQHSLVINIAINKKNILLMGDASSKEEQALIIRKKLPTNISTLIVGHHGADDATSKEFLRTIKPETAVISVNKNNIRGYPTEATINRLKAMNIKILRTDIQGDIPVFNK